MSGSNSKIENNAGTIELSARATLLNKMWDEHCNYEFSAHDVDATMKTMTEQPYVNHIPTMTGGTGQVALRKFYSEHFIPNLPPDTEVKLVSRTIGETKVVDEIIFCCTHDRKIDFMIPGIAPTGLRLEVPMVAIVTFEGDKIANEHIYWDQATVLVQLGLLSAQHLPVAGIEATRKLLNKDLPSNQLIERCSKAE